MLKINIFAALALTASIYPLYAAEERTGDKVLSAVKKMTASALTYCVEHPARAVAVAAFFAALFKPKTAPYGAGATLAAYEIEFFCIDRCVKQLRTENDKLSAENTQLKISNENLLRFFGSK